MKKFKAMFAATAAVMALSAVSVPMSAFAEDTPRVAHGTEQVFKYEGAIGSTGDWQPTKNDDMKLDPNPNTKVNVDFSINPTYTVTIPADVTFTDSNREKNAQVIVKDVFLAPEKAVEVTVASNNHYEMRLNGTDNNFYIPYSLNKVVSGEGDTEPISHPEMAEDLVVTVPTGSQDVKGEATVNLQYKIKEEVVDASTGQTKPYDVPRAGSYSDLLTFTIKVVGNN